MYTESTTSRWCWTRELGSDKLLFRMRRIAFWAFINVLRERMLVHWLQASYESFSSCIICEGWMGLCVRKANVTKVWDAPEMPA